MCESRLFYFELDSQYTKPNEDFNEGWNDILIDESTKLGFWMLVYKRVDHITSS